MVYPEGRSLQHPEQITSNAPRLHYSAAAAWLNESLTNSRGSRVAGRGSWVQSRGRGSNVAAGENDLEFEVTE